MNFLGERGVFVFWPLVFAHLSPHSFIVKIQVFAHEIIWNPFSSWLNPVNPHAGSTSPFLAKPAVFLLVTLVLQHLEVSMRRMPMPIARSRVGRMHGWADPSFLFLRCRTWQLDILEQNSRPSEFGSQMSVLRDLRDTVAFFHFERFETTMIQCIFQKNWRKYTGNKYKYPSVRTRVTQIYIYIYDVCVCACVRVRVCVGVCACVYVFLKVQLRIKKSAL